MNWNGVIAVTSNFSENFCVKNVVPRRLKILPNRKENLCNSIRKGERETDGQQKYHWFSWKSKPCETMFSETKSWAALPEKSWGSLGGRRASGSRARVLWPRPAAETRWSDDEEYFGHFRSVFRKKETNKKIQINQTLINRLIHNWWNPIGPNKCSQVFKQTSVI